MAESADIAQLRRITGAGETEYIVDGITFWTDTQLEEILDRHTTGVAPDLTVDFDAAAAEVLEAWAARLALTYDVTMDGQSLKRSQMAAQVKARSAEARSRASGGDIRSVQTIAPF